eukprot:gb/GECG01009320.1/.p1 GENE.gb/GECG01009320.1/~~gb/GECG01009320.1/.p1  ORF type:complete len:105 (+),score=3.72 gb/GECG01009320.1/:1-315(+)
MLHSITRKRQRLLVIVVLFLYAAAIRIIHSLTHSLHKGTNYNWSVCMQDKCMHVFVVYGCSQQQYQGYPSVELEWGLCEVGWVYVWEAKPDYSVHLATTGGAVY